jgi:hypothetical protein
VLDTGSGFSGVAKVIIRLPPSFIRSHQQVIDRYLYWWQMFARGYAFEIAIYRDLTASGIAHTAHGLRDRQARLAGLARWMT